MVTHCTGGHGAAAPADPPGCILRDGSSGRSRPQSQPVHPERVLCGGVGEDHVGVVEHVQSIQGQRVNFEFIQRELGILSKLTSPTPAKELVSSFDKLGGDSPVTAGNRTHRRCLDGENSSLKVIKQLPKTLGTFMELSDK